MGDNSEKNRFHIDNSVWRIDMQKQFFDMMEIQNRRFMYNPDTCTFILGRQYGKSNKIESSHAEEHFIAGASEPYDSFIKGWIGTSKQYNHGIIHFSPPIEVTLEKMFVDGYNTLQMFRENGAVADTVIRGFCGAWEQPLSKILPGFTEQTKGEDLINMPMTELKQQLILQELAKIGFTEAYYIPASDNIKVQPDNDRMPFIRGDDMIFYGTEYNNLVQETIKPLVNKVNDMIAGREPPQYYGVWAVRSAASVAGHAEAWSKDDGIPLVFTSQEAAERQAAQYNENTASRNVHYYAKEMEPEIALDALNALKEREKTLAAEANSQSVYVYPAAYAREHGELDQYRASNRLNRECAQAIDETVRDNWNGSRLNPDCARAVIEKYGLERVNTVLANTVHQKEYDLRFSRDNRDWANSFPRLEKGLDFYADAHSVKLDEFIKLARDAGELGRGERPSAVEKLEAAKQAVKPPAPGAPGKKKDIEME